MDPEDNSSTSKSEWITVKPKYRQNKVIDKKAPINHASKCPNPIKLLSISTYKRLSPTEIALLFLFGKFDKLLAEKQSLLQFNEWAVKRISFLNPIIYKQMEIRQKYLNQLDEYLEACGQRYECEYEYGCKYANFVENKQDPWVLEEIKNIRKLIYNKNAWKRFCDNLGGNEELRGCKALQQNIRKNQKVINEINNALKRIPSTKMATINLPNIDDLSKPIKKHQSIHRPSHRSERHTIKVTNLPQEYDLLELRQALYQEFGNSKSINKTATCPIKKLYISKSKTEVFIKYFNSEDAENIVNMHGHYQIYGHELNVEFARSSPNQPK